MAIRFGTTNEDLLDAQLWATGTTGLVHLIEVMGEERNTVSFELGHASVTDTHGVLYGVHESELDAFTAEHGEYSTLTLDTFRDGQNTKAWARQMLDKFRRA